MKKLLFILAVLCLFIGGRFDSLMNHFEEEGREKNEPNLWFSLQRSYPETVFPARAFIKAMEMAGHVSYKDKPSGFDETWKAEGPNNIGGRFNTLAIDPSNKDIIYAGAAAGGVFKTTDGGKNWYPVFDEHAWLAIGTIVIDPKDHNTLYVGTGDPNISGNPAIGDGLYKSTDAGKTWQHLGLSGDAIISRIVIDPDSTNIMYAATMGLPFVRDSSRGLYKTTDGGKNWQKIFFLGPDAGIIDLVMQPGNSNVLYACGWGRIRNNWETITVNPKNKVYKSTDAGKSWKAVFDPGPCSRIGLAVSAQNPQKVYGVVVDSLEYFKAVYKSTTGGADWSELPKDGLGAEPMGNFGWYFGKLFLSPANDDIFYLPGVELWKYEDGQYSKASPPWYTYEVHADKHDLQWLDQENFILATDGGIYKYTAIDDNWTDIENMPVTQFYHVSVNPFKAGLYYGGAQDNGTDYGNASGMNAWVRLFGGDGFQPVFDMEDSARSFVEVQYGDIYALQGNYFTTYSDGIDQSDRRNWDMPYLLSGHNHMDMYTGTYRMYKNKEGNGWESISDDLTTGPSTPSYLHTISSIAESPLRQGYIFSGTSDGRVWRSLDDGKNWKEISAGLPVRYVTRLKASPFDENTIYVTHSGYKDNDFIPHIHKSTDLGEHWTDISGDLPQAAVNDLLICPKDSDILFAATDVGVYATKDGGIHWFRMGSNMPVFPVMEVTYDYLKHRLAAATFARSIMTYPLDSIFSPMLTGIHDDLRANSGFKAFPNPFFSGIHIELPVTASEENASFELIDIHGRVMKKNNIRTPNGRLDIEAEDLPKGIYIIKVNLGSKEYSSKLMKL